VLTMALPSEPRKGPKAPAAELPSKGSRSISKYMNRIWGRIGGYNVGWQRPCMHAILSNQPFSNPFLEEKGIRSLMNRGDRKLPRLLSVPSPCSTLDAGGPMPRTGSVPLSYIAWRSLSKIIAFPFNSNVFAPRGSPVLQDGPFLSVHHFNLLPE